MDKIIECIPNFSEGRDAEKVELIISAIASVAGVVVLDAEMDADHHRSVITMAGEPAAVVEAAVVEAAVEEAVVEAVVEEAVAEAVAEEIVAEAVADEAEKSE